MKFLINTAIALLIGVLSAALAVIFQNDIANWFGRAPVTAIVQAGPWHPIPHSLDSKKHARFSEIEYAQDNKYSGTSDAKFAKVVIENNSVLKIDNVFVVYKLSEPRLDILNLDILYPDPEGEGMIFAQDVNRVDIGPLEAASSKSIYIWSDLNLVNYSGVTDLKIKTGAGDAPIKTISAEYAGAYAGFPDYIDSLLYWFIFVVMALLIFIFGYIMFRWAKLSRALLISDDFYLDQKVVYEKDPKSYEPKSFPCDVEALLKQRHG